MLLLKVLHFPIAMCVLATGKYVSFMLKILMKFGSYISRC